MGEVCFELDCDITSPHFHDGLEIMYILSGRIAVMQTGKNYLLGPEDLIVFNPFEYHEHYREAGNHTLSLFVPFEILQDAKIGNIVCCSRLHPEREDFFVLLRAKLAVLYREISDRTEESELRIKSQIYGLLAVLKQQFEEPEEIEGGEDERGRIRRALNYILENYTEDVTLQDAADRIFVSKGQLSRMFRKYMGMSFADYLRKLRTIQAAHLLRSTEKKITDIALECGFSNTNTMILNFREEYGETPGAYRKSHPKGAREEKGSEERTGISFMPLLKYAVREEEYQPLTLKQQKAMQIHIDMDRQGIPFSVCSREAVTLGNAKELLTENMRNAVREAVKVIGFRYGIVSGLFDDALDVYHEDENGDVRLSFTYMDMVTDFLADTGITPWIELGNTPLALAPENPEIYGSSCVSLPTDLGKWGGLVRGVLCHFQERYGRESCAGWKFSAMNEVYATYFVFTEEDYLEYYRETYRCLKEVMPEARIAGWTLDTAFLRRFEGRTLERFLKYSKEQDCIPDEFSFQILQADVSQIDIESNGREITGGTGKQRREPTPIDANENILSEDLDYVHGILERHGFGERPVAVTRWNASSWYGNLAEDTCFNGALVFKAYLENAGKMEALSYSNLTDISERMLTNINLFSGGLGLMTYQGIPKAAFHAMELLNRLDHVLLEKGDGYAVTRSEDGKRFQIAMYHYCHYDPDTHLNHSLPPEEERTYDRYYDFVDPGTKILRFSVSGMEEGTYDKETYTVSRECGSSYDLWMKMGAPETVTRRQRDYIRSMSLPGYQYEKMYVGEGMFQISAALKAHEIRIICIKKR